MTDPKRCPSVDPAHGAQCDLPVGHPGSHASGIAFQDTPVSEPERCPTCNRLEMTMGEWWKQFEVRHYELTSSSIGRPCMELSVRGQWVSRDDYETNWRNQAARISELEADQ